MLTPQNLHEYQRKAVLHQLYHPHSMLWLGCSLGKTIITLSTIEHRMRAGLLKKTIIFGPLRVVHTVWDTEAVKWSHTDKLRFSIIHGDAKKRERQLFADADIYLCNYENMAWLSNVLMHYYIDQGKPLPFEMCVYDEVTRIKKATSKRMAGGKRITQKQVVEMLPLAGTWTYDQFREQGWTDHKLQKNGYCNITPEQFIKLSGWHKIIPHLKYRTGLTGTPAPCGYLDLHGQFFGVDGGERLGPNISSYRDAYFSAGYNGWSHELTDIGKQWIEHKIADITIKMDTEDYIELPPLKVNDIMVDLPKKWMQHYHDVEKDMFTQLDDGTEIEVFSRASVSNKCLQISNGNSYNNPGEPEYTVLHDEKLQVLDSIVEEAAGKPMIVGYNFRSDAEIIIKRYKKRKGFNVIDIKKTPVTKLKKVIEDCAKGKVHMIVGHAASIGHGIDGLQKSCNILVWFGLTWDLELYEQLMRRLLRQGQTKPVTMHRIMSRDTIDLAVADALRRKDGDQVGLKKAIQRYRDGMIPKDGSMSFM